jgi:AcrR family transcriptional regulator
LGGRTLEPKRLLLETALRLFSRDGITATSLRSIVAEARVGNQSAIHYHFGGRDGLVRALARDVAEPLLERQLASLGALEARPDVPTVREVLAVVATPQIELALSGKRGLDAATFLARLISELGRPGQLLLFELFGDGFARTATLLSRSLPEKPMPVLRLHLLLAINGIFHGAVDMPLLNAVPGAIVRLDASRSGAIEDAPLFVGFLDYITGGVSSGR